jgi:nitrile hydratase
MGPVNGPHDLGGMDGFGRVPYSADERPFHEDWEGRTFALAGAAATHGVFGTPMFRHAMERIEPGRYLNSGYFERWCLALATLLVEKGIVDPDEVSDVPLSASVRVGGLEAPGADVTEPRFRVGEGVRVRNEHPLGHTRCPRYVRGRRGVVVRYDGPCNFDDVEAHSDGKRLDPLYCVRFEGSELWGGSAEPGVTVTVDLFETYLEAL